MKAIMISRPGRFLLAARGLSSVADTVVDRCTKKIRESLNPSYIRVVSSNDDPNGSHIAVTCVSNAFAQKNIVQRQRLVYKALWQELERDVHAVDSIVALTAEEAKERNLEML